ncbi:MAG: hypothetical protein Q8N07_07265 [Rhodocyclaceae bacterium]|nr:hypothetical protein [Rhodocyclaceae bacterium]
MAQVCDELGMADRKPGCLTLQDRRPSSTWPESWVSGYLRSNITLMKWMIAEFKEVADTVTT